MRNIELTTSELRVLRLAGLSTNDIAQRLNLKPFTVTLKLNKIYTKLRVENRTQAVIIAIRDGYIDPRMFEV